jgi:hypothetical protein
MRSRRPRAAEQVVGDALDVAPLDAREPRAAEGGEDVEAKRALVLADDGGPVAFSGLRADRAARDPVDEGLCSLEKRLGGAGETNTLRRLRLGRCAPATRVAEGLECLRDLALADRVVSRDAIARTAVAALAASRRTRAGVADFDSLSHQARPTLARVPFRSNQRSSSARAMRMRRPRRTTRSSPMTCSSR